MPCLKINMNVFKIGCKFVWCISIMIIWDQENDQIIVKHERWTVNIQPLRAGSKKMKAFKPFLSLESECSSSFQKEKKMRCFNKWNWISPNLTIESAIESHARRIA